MSHRDTAAVVLALLTAACPAGVLAALKTGWRGDSLCVLFLGAGMLCGVYAVLGWGLYLFTGVFR